MNDERKTEPTADCRLRIADLIRCRPVFESAARSPQSAIATAFGLLFFALFVLLYPAGAAGPARDDDDLAASASLLEVGGAPKLAAPDPSPSEIKIVSYNIRYRAGEDLQQLIALLKGDAEIGGAAVIGLQEVDRNKKRTDNTNTARILAESLGMYYAWAAPPPPRPKEGKKKKKGEKEPEEETGVAILSPYPMRDVERLVLTHEGPNRRRRAAVGATLRIGVRDVRVYSVHAETRMPVEKKVEHWRAVLEDLGRYPKVEHVVVVGDFNTIKGKDVRAARTLFTDAGFSTPFPDGDATFKVFFLDFKLDWVWLRGLAHVDYGIDRQVGLSDHWPLWVRVRLAGKAAPPSEPPSPAAVR